ncbi:MAG: Crp/Fnr family transcriptional regulator [Sphingobacteriia bacterium]|nr:Crp/Fnr family transcriptional regulator [Sphingobacteriia bacterium]NCC38013.1 Crp/Fnr family transcriptional regulator [Gammaproteobacteria bacterium]
MRQDQSLPDFIPRPLLDLARDRVLSKGERLFSQGCPVEAIYFVQRGRLKAVRTLSHGSQSVMIQATAGEFFAESALAAESYVCDAFATTETRVTQLPAKAVLDAFDAGGNFARAFALAMAANARRQCSRYERVRLKRARDRVIHLLVCEGGPEATVPLTMPLVELAEELALEPETLYRVLRELTDEGILERSRDSLRLIGALAD